VTERQLKTSLRAAAHGSSEPLTLVIHMDASVSYGQLAHLAEIAREKEIGITNVLLATVPEPAGTTNHP
jgi:biopolymer transport protein ExbD